MPTKKQLYDSLALLQEENCRLRKDNEVMKSALYSIYNQAKQASGIETAIADREEERLRKLEG